MVIFDVVLKIEVLGVSLPWTGMFTMNNVGSKFIDQLKETPEQSKSFLFSSDMRNSERPLPQASCLTSDHEAFSSKGNIVESAKPSAVSHGIDLLTGDLLFSHSTSHPVSSSVKDGALQSGGSVIDFFDNSGTDCLFQGDANSTDESQDDNGDNQSRVQSYIHIYNSLTSNKVRLQFSVSFCMEKMK